MKRTMLITIYLLAALAAWATPRKAASLEDWGPGLDLLCTDGGLQVSAIREASPAQDAGIRPGDRLVSIDDAAVGDPGALPRLR